MQRLSQIKPTDQRQLFESIWRPEASLRVADIDIRIGHYDWPDWVETEVEIASHQLSLSLSPRPFHTQGRHGGSSGGGDYRDAGDMIFFPAEVPFYGRSSGGFQRLLMCSFDPARVERFKPADGGWAASELNRALDLQDDQLRATLMRIGREAINPGFASDILLETLMNTLAIDLVRYLQQTPEVERASRGGLASWQMRRIRERVESDRDTSPTIDELAVLCGISSRHVMRGFKQSTGSTLHTYVEQVRLARARQLLLDTDQPMKIIASQLGFSQTSSFSAAFRRALGISPSAFRARQRY